MSTRGGSNAPGERVCTIDLGTNSFHALVVELHPERVPQIVDKLKEPVGLGANGLSTRMLTHDAVSRAERALTRIKTLADRRGVSRIRAYATSAIREAKNGDEFIAHVRRRIGLEIRPIAGELEARLIYLGVRDTVDLAEPSLLVDVGGGSTELVIGDRGSMRFGVSLKLGAARLNKAFVSTDPVSSEELASLTAHIDARLAPVLSMAREEGVRQLVGSSGTMENLGELAHHRAGRRGTVFQHSLDAGELVDLTDELVASSRADREAMNGLDPERVDQIVAGAILVKRLIESLEPERVVFSPAALRDGMVVELAQELGDDFARLLEEPDIVRRRCLELGIRHRFDEPHARHVAALADDLFSELAPLHELDERARKILDRAALIHDVGHAISGTRHHKHTRYIIEQAEWPGVAPEEVALMAMVGRYHRRAVPKKKHKRFKRLDKANRRTVRKLSAMLRLANGLDRSHIQNTRALEVQLGRDRVHVILTTRSDPELELSAANETREAFERAFGRSLEVSAAWMP